MSDRLSQIRVRRALVRRDAATLPSRSDPAVDVGRIERLTQAARVSWLALLSFLALALGVALGADDVDFFVPGSETIFPQFGFKLPTRSVFALVPLFAAVLFAYQQQNLMRLVHAVARLPVSTRDDLLSSQTSPWIINELLVLVWQDPPRGSAWVRRMRKPGLFLLGFAHAPIVLVTYWYISMRSLDELLTVVFCGLPLLVVLSIIAINWRRIMALRTPGQPLTGSLLLGLLALWFAVTYAGWCATEGTLRGYLRALGITDESLETRPVLARLSNLGALLPLHKATLKDVDFVGIPGSWRAAAAAEVDFRKNWCVREGIPATACLYPRRSIYDSLTQGSGDIWSGHRALVVSQRNRYCTDALELGDGTADCTAYFAHVEARQANAWQIDRQSKIRGLTPPSLAGRDLRGVDLSRARLEGMDLAGARLQQASLIDTFAEGAYFFEARMQGAVLIGVEAQNAVFALAKLRDTMMSNADLRKADFSLADMRGARLNSVEAPQADLQLADLSGAHLDLVSFDRAMLSMARLRDTEFGFVILEGADLSGTDLTGALLRNTWIDGTTILDGASFQFAALWNIDLGRAKLQQSQIDVAFGDGSVTLPANLDRPAHWPAASLERDDFETRWRNWQRANGYEPPAGDGAKW